MPKTVAMHAVVFLDICEKPEGGVNTPLTSTNTCFQMQRRAVAPARPAFFSAHWRLTGQPSASRGPATLPARRPVTSAPEAACFRRSAGPPPPPPLGASAQSAHVYIMRRWRVRLVRLCRNKAKGPLFTVFAMCCVLLSLSIVQNLLLARRPITGEIGRPVPYGRPSCGPSHRGMASRKAGIAGFRRTTWGAHLSKNR